MHGAAHSRLLRRRRGRRGEGMLENLWLLRRAVLLRPIEIKRVEVEHAAHG
jgi:hypothetical protein